MSAFAHELILGFKFPFACVFTGLGLQPTMEPYEYFEPRDRSEEINNLLGGAHRKALTRMGFTNLRSNESSWATLTIADTPLGEREFAPFQLELFFDPYEVGDTEEDAIIGIGISGRYFPVFADWKNRSGTLDTVVFDDELERVMAIAKEEIVTVLPVFADAVWIVKMKHY